MDSYITFNTYRTTNVVYTHANSRQLQSQTYRTYYRIPLMYNFGTHDNQVLRDFLFECCEMETKVGIISETFENGYIQYKIPCQFNLSNPDHMICYNCFKEIYQATMWILNSLKKDVNLHLLSETNYPSPIYNGNNINLNLYYRGTGHAFEQSLFTDPQGQRIPWDLLTNVSIRFIPLLRVKYLHIIEGRVSLEMEIVSAVITAIN